MQVICISRSQQPSILDQWLRVLRDHTLQQNREKFRRYTELISIVLAYHVSKHLAYREVQVETPLATATCKELAEQVVIASVLRAGVLMHMAFLQVFESAESAFVSARRYQNADGTFDVVLEYISCPPLNGKTLIVVDCMLATATTLIASLTTLIQRAGTPARMLIACIIASQEGIKRVEEAFPEALVFAAAVDPELNSKGYIVPGLGDAGNLLFG